MELTLLSLGAGVQSTTLALMAAEGTLPHVDGAIFADTGWEPAEVYSHLERLSDALSLSGIPVYRVKWGNLRADALDPAHGFTNIPYFVLRANGTRGMGQRRCTTQYKLDPINRKVRELLGADPPRFQRVQRGRHADLWIGFSVDEIGRVSDRGNRQYLTRRYPLLDLGMDRKACQRWLGERGWTVVKSACIGCPFHGNRQWRDLRDNRPDEWADAVAFDEAIRNGGAHPLPKGDTAYLHASRVPLAVAPIDIRTRGELDEDAENGVVNGCSPFACRSSGP